MSIQLQSSWWSDLCEFFRISYDPRKDFNSDLPVRTRTRTTTDLRVATTDDSDTHRAPDNKLYGRTTETNDSGADVFVLDSTDTRTDTNVPEDTNKFDEYVFKSFASSDTYKHFDWELYKLIKRHGFSKAEKGKALGYRKAAKVSEIKKKEGCSERYVSNYYKAMRIAFNLYLNNAPLPSE